MFQTSSIRTTKMKISNFNTTKSAHPFWHRLKLKHVFCINKGVSNFTNEKNKSSYHLRFHKILIWNLPVYYTDNKSTNEHHTQGCPLQKIKCWSRNCKGTSIFLFIIFFFHVINVLDYICRFSYFTHSRTPISFSL